MIRWNGVAWTLSCKRKNLVRDGGNGSRNACPPVISWPSFTVKRGILLGPLGFS